MDISTPAVVFGLPETGLAVSRSLGRNKIKVYGVAYRKETACSSRYIKPNILSHPILEESRFIEEIRELCNNLSFKPVLFIAADEYLTFYQKNSQLINELFIHNLPGAELIEQISDKYLQYQLALKAGIDVPKTVFWNGKTKEEDIDLEFPVFIKARDVNTWRRVISDSTKGFEVRNIDELNEKLNLFKEEDVAVILQEIVQSKDSQNYKACVLMSDAGKAELMFTLRKIHQSPVHFGVASCAVSIDSRELEEIGLKLFSAINYKGVGSAEFKYDERDGKMKLIEINSRYWQQNALAEFCGMNFPLVDYQLATNQCKQSIKGFMIGYKWLNLTLNIASYKGYKKAGEITFWRWLTDISGRKTISFLALDDINPFLVFLVKRLNILKSRIKKLIKRLLRL